MKKTIIIFIVIIFIVVISGGFWFLTKNKAETPGEASKKNLFTFKVTVPENTPEEDTIFLLITDIPPSYIESPMKKVGDNTWQLSFTESELKDAFDFPKILYRYTRNGWGFGTAEFLPEGIAREPNIKPEDEHGSGYAYRLATFAKGKTAKDSVSRWRWFPEGKIVLQDTSDLGPTGTFEPRVNESEFRLGQGIEDLYIPQFEPFFDKVPKRFKDKGYNWVVVYPPWQWIETDPMPKVGRDYETTPDYPDEKLIAQIQAYKKAGIKVYIEPQLCCDAVDTQNRSSEWWDEFISEIEKFLIHHARLGNIAGADALLFENYNVNQEMTGYSEKMKQVFDKVKAEFNGEIAMKVSAFLPEGVTQATSFIPDIEKISWGNDVDFFMYDAEGQLSSKDDPTREELVTGAGKILDLVKPLNDKFNKPIWVRSTYFAVKHAWKGTEFLHSGKIPAHETYDLDYAGHEFSGLDQARVDDAFFEAIMLRPWIIGFLHFGYTHWDMPLLPDWSIRSREAEEVWVKWNRFIRNT